MTDLVSMTELYANLAVRAEPTTIRVGEAEYVLATMHDTYEAERATKEQAAIVLQAQVTSLSLQVGTLNAQVTSGTQQNSQLTATVATLQAQLDTLGTQAATLTQANSELTAIITDLQAQLAALNVQLAATLPDATLTIGGQAVVSRFAPALTWISNPNTWRQAGWPNVVKNIPPLIGAQSTHFSPFGNGVAWHWDGTSALSPAPNNLYGETTGGGTIAKPALNSFVGSLVKMREVDPTGPLHVKIFMAEWWMKHEIGLTGTATNATYADRFDAEKGRVKFTRLAEWKLLVKTACKIAFAAPYNVRWVSVWNELKEYWDNVKGRFDMTYNAGTETTPMGFVYFYEQTVQAILAAASELSIPVTEIKIGGAYAPLRGRGTLDSTAVPVGHMLRGRPYGSGDKHAVIAFETFITEVKARNLKLDFISVDGADGNKDNVYPAADDYVNGLRWHDWHVWIRDVLSKAGLDSTMPIIWDEWYRKPLIKPPTGTLAEKQAVWVALKADTFITMVMDGVMWPMSWGPEPLANDDGCGSMLTAAASVSGGQVAPFGELCRIFKDNFGPGKAVYPVTVAGSGVSGIASDEVVYIVGHTNAPMKVRLESAVYDLAPYERRLVNRL